MARTWLSISVELVSGRGTDFRPRSGRIFAVARTHTLDRFATAINLAFAPWDLTHMHAFTLAGGHPGHPLDLDLWDGEAPDGSIDSATTKLSRPEPDEQFSYVFDLGDDWAHLCTVAAQRIDPLDTVGVVTAQPMPYFGWGDVPDQYDRQWNGGNG